MDGKEFEVIAIHKFVDWNIKYDNMNKTLLKNIGIYAGILLLFIGLAYGYTPQVLDGMIVNQSDIASWKGMANEAVTHNAAHPDDPTAWTNSMFGGMPTTATIDSFEGDWTDAIYDFLLTGRRPASYLLLALIGGFLLMLSVGTSKIVAAATYLAVMEKGMLRQETTLEAGGATHLITPKPADDGTVLPKYAAEVEKLVNGQKSLGKKRFFHIPLEVLHLGDTPVDLNILGSHKDAVTALCFVYRIPVDLYYGQAKYENAKEAKKTIYEQNAIPLANEFAEDLITFLMKKDKSLQGYRLTVNTDMIDVLKDKSTDVLNNLNLAYCTLNERREAIGYERIEEEYAYKPIIPMGMQFGEGMEYDIDETL